MILVVVLALLIPTALIGIYSINITTEEVLRTGEAKNLEFVRSQSAAALRFLAEGERDVLFLSQSPATRRYVGALVAGDDTGTQVLLTSQLMLFLKDNPDYMSIRILAVSGQEVLGVDNTVGQSTDIPSTMLENQANQSYFIETLRLAGHVYISDIGLNTDHERIVTPYVPIIRFSLPLYAEGGGIAGVIVLKAIAVPMVNPAGMSPDDTLYSIDDTGDYLSHPDPNKLFGNILKTGVNFAKERPQDNAVIRASSEGSLFSSQDRPDLLQAFATVAVPNRDDAHWTFVYEEKQNKLLSEINNGRSVIVGLASLALLIALGVAWLITRNIVLPVQQLARISVSISRGEWDVAIPSVKSGDEIGKLALAFERMSRELQTLYDNLENRVIARTSELETVAKVSAAAAAILDLDQLLQTISNLTKASFNLSLTRVYLLDEPTQTLILSRDSEESDLTDPTAVQRIALDTTDSVVARAGRVGSGLVVKDEGLRHDADGTTAAGPRSELAVPLRVANKLLGVLDLHSDQADHFTDSELRVMTILADQVAVAVQNASLYKTQLATTRQLAIERRRAEEANKAKSLFLSNMSHELRTPLNIVIGYTSSMLERPSMYNNVPLPAEYANDIRLIKENGYHLIGLINDILDLSKIEAGKLELVCEMISLSDIFRGVLSTSVGLVKDKPVLIKSDLPDQLPRIWADPTRVRQIILNLMSNAVKFTDRGSVTLRARTEDGFIKISVIDSGIGIPDKALPYIFDRFQQASHDTSKHYGGTGLGLDISKQLCQMHGGDLTVESVYGEGSTFTFSLPLSNSQGTQISATQPANVDQLDGQPRTSQVFALPTDGTLQMPIGGTIMLVGDEIGTIDLLRRTLEETGYYVFSTGDKAEVLEMAIGLVPDAIILDLSFSNGEGRDMLTKLQREAEIAACPILVCIGQTDRAFAQNYEASCLLSKPLIPQEIMQAVQQVTHSTLPSQPDPHVGD